jgi:hypothetical protein
MIPTGNYDDFAGEFKDSDPAADDRGKPGAALRGGLGRVGVGSDAGAWGIRVRGESRFMATRRPGACVFRPTAEGLEGRKLLSGLVRGVDIDGDRWTLRLVGPGDLRVINQPDADDFEVPLGEPALISEIDVAGTIPLASRLIGRVRPAAGGDGKVFFESFRHLGAPTSRNSAPAGITTIDMPGFWLGHTSTAAPTAGTPAASISIPNGVITLRFGGADTTFTPPGGTPLDQNTTSDTFTIDLGIPRSWGTSIIVSKMVSSGTRSGTTTTQDSITVTVRGRINLFQADAIEGNADVPSTGFLSGTTAQGGTLVRSIPDTTDATVFGTGITGQIGYVRVGNNATNFSVQTNDRISNYFVGGETENILVLAPTGLRNVYFGKGMDTASIFTNELNTLAANRGALGSTVIVDERAGELVFGGDVVDTTFLAGYQGLPARVFLSQTAPDVPPPVRDEGAIGKILIAGDVIDSVFAASVDPTFGVFGTPDSLELPHGKISAKIEGTIQNETATPDSPEQAFYSRNVFLTRGPVTPPTVPEAPFPHPGAPPSGPRLGKDLQPTRRRNGMPTSGV